MGVTLFQYLVSITILVASCYGWQGHYGVDYGESTYIHSNDTMTLELSDETQLRGEAGRKYDLEFVLHNRGTAAHFTISGKSEDGFNGRLSTTEQFLQNDGMATIRVSQLIVPQGHPKDSKLRYTLKVRRDDSNINKRAADPQGPPVDSRGGQGGGSFNGGGYPGGNSDQGGSFNGGGRPGGNGGQGGSFNGGGYPGGNDGQGGSFNGGGSSGGNGGQGGGSFNDGGRPGGNGGQGGGGSFNGGGSSGGNGGQGGSFNDGGRPGGNGGQGGSYNSGSSSNDRYKHSRNDRPDYNSGSNVASQTSIILTGVLFSYFVNIIFGVNSSRSTFCRRLQPLFWVLTLLQYSQGQSGQIGGSGGGMGGSGGSMGGQGGFVPNKNNRIPNRGPNYWNDPSFVRELSLTVEFTVVDSDDIDDRETHDPSISAEFAAQSYDETCGEAEEGMVGCEKWWWVRFTTEDSNSGIRDITMDNSVPDGNARPDWNNQDTNEVYYRYEKFPVGTDKEVQVFAGTSCCNSHMRIEVTDVMDNKAEYHAKNTDYGSGYPGGLSKAAFWGIIGGAIALVLIIVIVVSVVCAKKKCCSGYSQTSGS